MTPLSLADVLPLLVDPKSREPLVAHASETLVAREAARAFPITAEIPMLMPKDARPASEEERGAAGRAEPSRRDAASVEVMVLDVGTKTGKGVKRVHEEHWKRLGMPAGASWGVVGIDLQHSRLLEARKHGIFAVKADGARMPFADGSFDLTVVTELLEHVPRELAVDVMKEARRVTRGAIFIQNPDFTSEPYLREKGLKFTWMDWKVHPHHITADGMRSVLEEAGFTSFDVEQIRPVRDSSSRELVSLETPRDTQFFDPDLHTKPTVTFDQPVYEKLRVVLDLRRHTVPS
jgi:uncharacterized protein YbaR (Trm112 family)